MQIINTTIHERLKFTRIYFGYSQTELAKMLDVKQSVYANWELNKRLIPLRHLISLANIYQIGDRVDIVGNIGINRYKDIENIQITLKDIRQSI